MVTRVRVRRLALRSPDRPSVQEEEEVLVSSRLVSSRLTWDVDITFVGFRDVFPVGRVRQVRSPPWLRITLAWPRFRDLLLLEFDPPLRHPCRRRRRRWLFRSRSPCFRSSSYPFCWAISVARLATEKKKKWKSRFSNDKRDLSSLWIQ